MSLERILRDLRSTCAELKTQLDNLEDELFEPAPKEQAKEQHVKPVEKAISPLLKSPNY